MRKKDLVEINPKVLKSLRERFGFSIEEIANKLKTTPEKIEKVWADPWLIALAICEKGIIVSDEKNAPNRIPYIANHFGIQCLNRFDFFKKIGIKY